MNKFNLLILLFLAGCAGQEPNIRPQNFDSGAVGSMQFSIRQIAESRSGHYSEQQRIDMATEISTRFSDAGYPVTSAQAASNGKSGTVDPRYTHRLEVEVGPESLTGTPSGLSISFGNSDPRSTNFQKAMTIPVSCTLKSLDNSHPPITLKERKTASTDFDLISKTEAGIVEKTKRFYIENIGGTCHNLLEKLAIYPPQPSRTVQSTSPGKEEYLWEGVRMKIEDDVPAKSLQGHPETAADRHSSESKQSGAEIPESAGTVSTEAQEQELRIVPASKPVDIPEMPIQPVAESPGPDTVRTSPEPEASAGQEQPTVSVKTEDSSTGDWRKKKITIFNQGDTVILRFGNDLRR